MISVSTLNSLHLLEVIIVFSCTFSQPKRFLSKTGFYVIHALLKAGFTVLDRSWALETSLGYIVSMLHSTNLWHTTFSTVWLQPMHSWYGLECWVNSIRARGPLQLYSLCNQFQHWSHILHKVLVFSWLLSRASAHHRSELYSSPHLLWITLHIFGNLTTYIHKLSFSMIRKATTCLQGRKCHNLPIRHG